MYLGSNDCNIYCLDDYPVTTGQILIQIEKNEVEENTTVTVCGQLMPSIAYAPITVTLTKADGTVDSIQVTAQRDGAFSFDYTPDVIGNVKVFFRCSGATYLMQDAELQFTVTETVEEPEPDQTPDDQGQDRPQNSDENGIPTLYTIVAVVIVIVAAVALVAYLFVKRRDRSSPVVISD